MSETIIKKPRIEYIDLAKGFCIILVVFYHAELVYHWQLPGSTFMKAFRMPLYFFLSGCFFKAYEGFWGFFKRKVNKLLIPFISFYFLFSVGTPLIKVHLLDIETRTLPIDEIFTAFLTESYPNQPIWFLLCLFEDSILFYLLYLFAQRFENKSNIIISAGSILIGIIGILLGMNHINLLATLDSALSSLPFFAFGYFAFRKTNILKPNQYDKYLPLLILLAFTLVFFFCSYYSLLKNSFSLRSALVVYPCGFLGTYGVVMLAKLLKKLPLISYFGRYSIMILVSHVEIICLFKLLFRHMGLNLPSICLIAINLILTMLSYLLIIPFMRKFMPHITAQKDLITV